MRLNQFVALATGLSRRAADQAIQNGRVTVNQQVAGTGQIVDEADSVKLDRQLLKIPAETITIMLNKPAGYVSSRSGQGSRTVYDLLPKKYHRLKPVGRLDKDSSGLLLLTNNGQLANRLTHPRYAKTKVYEVTLDKPLEPKHREAIIEGVELDDGPSRLNLKKLDRKGMRWEVTMTEGRNRQIRRTFAALGYEVDGLRRVSFGDYVLDDLKESETKVA